MFSFNLKFQTFKFTFILGIIIKENYYVVSESNKMEQK